MNSWSKKLVLSYLVTVVASVIVCAILWTSGFTSIVSPVIVAIGIFLILILKLKIFAKWQWCLLGAIPMLVVMIAMHFLFSSANHTAKFETLAQYVETKDKPLYFELDEYYVDYDGVGDVEVTTTTKKHGTVKSTRRRNYVVYPAISDTNSMEIIAWIADSYGEEEYRNTEYIDDLLNIDKILYFETASPDQYEDYNKALGYSSYKTDSENVLYISPRYKPYITRNTWGLILLGALLAGGVIMVIIGFFVNKYKKKKELAARAQEERELAEREQAEREQAEREQAENVQEESVQDKQW